MRPTFKKIGRTLVFFHPCSKCGSDVAPFGAGVKLRAAMEEKNVEKAGTWLCGACWRDEVTT